MHKKWPYFPSTKEVKYNEKCLLHVCTDCSKDGLVFKLLKFLKGDTLLQMLNTIFFELPKRVMRLSSFICFDFFSIQKDPFLWLSIWKEIFIVNWKKKLMRWLNYKFINHVLCDKTSIKSDRITFQLPSKKADSHTLAFIIYYFL